MSKRDYYDILDVPRNATKEQIKSEYRKLALKYHPDRNKSSDAAERFKEISEAYGVLFDDEKRSEYDRSGREGIDEQYSPEDIFRGVDFDDAFRDLGFEFGGFNSVLDTLFRGRPATSSPRGHDLRYDLEISLEQVCMGLSTVIDVPRRERCPECNDSRADVGIASKCSICHGSGMVERQARISVKIPPGVDTGSQLVLRGMGDTPPDGDGPMGDLYVVISVRPHELFKREGNDLICNMNVSFSTAALGGRVEVQTLHGTARILIPPGTQSGAIFRLKGKGTPSLLDNGQGDQLVVLRVKTPVKLTPRQKELVEGLTLEGL